MPAFPVTVELADLDGQDGFRLVGAPGDGRFGFSIAVLGDVNGDGADDLGIMANGTETVWLGQQGPLAPSLPVDMPFPVTDNAAGLPDNLTYYDSRIVAIGDVNGDGFADFDRHIFYETDTYYEYAYGDSWVEIMFYDFATIQYGGGTAATAGKRFGDSGLEAVDETWLGAVGDINGDGFDDITVSVDAAFPPRSTLKVVFGSATGLPGSANRSAEASLGFTGASVREIHGAGDFNGDGLADLVVESGHYNGGDAYVIFGRSDLAAGTFDVTSLDGANGFRLPAAMDARSVGDVNGDGLDDIVVALWGRAPADPFYVVYGRTDSPAVIDAGAVDGSNGFPMVTGGRGVSAAGDINGDMLGDLIVGADEVVFGRPNVGAAGLDAGSVDGDNGFYIAATGIDVSGWDGWNIQAAGDVNGDGIDDIVIGTPRENTVHVILGHAATAVNWVGTVARENHGGSPENDVLNGMGGNDYLRGLGGDDILIGGPGGDILDGGAGNDTVGFGSTGNAVTVDLAAGTSTGHALGNDTLISIENMIGTGGADDLGGNGGDNRIDGGPGADRMAGHLGNDSYVVDNPGDVVIESRNQGIDSVEATLAAYVLGANVENLIYTGAGAFDATGNALANVITGGAGDDALNGGRGADVLRGGLGDDRYVVDHPGDVVAEVADAGFDTVETTLNYTLGANIEGLLLRGTAALSGIGNALANRLTGNAANNTLSGLDGADTLLGKGGNDKLLGGAGADRLDGGTGDDMMRGGLGDDVYLVDSAADVASEANGGGIDLVESTAASFILGSGLEHLTITTGQAAAATGNNLANTLTGGSGANVLMGLAGNDLLIGGAGNDTLDGGEGADVMRGGTGNDTYVVNRPDDVVDESGGGGTDTIILTAGGRYVLPDGIENVILGNAPFGDVVGNALNNHMTGTTDSDIFEGLGGADVFTGDPTPFGSSDIYRYSAAGFGKDTVTDFVADDTGTPRDILQFRTSVFADAADVLAHTAQVGADVVVTYSAFDKITLNNVALADFGADNLFFYT